MKLLLKSAVIVDPSSKHHLKKRDVLIVKGIIEKIAPSITDSKAKTISLKNLHISQGWFDSSVSFGEPGFEERETLENGLLTAAFSGFTSVAVSANCHPVTDSKSTVQFLKSKAKGSAVSLHPVGALSKNSEGKDLAELYDMQNEGAVSFYDYQKPISNPNLLKIALQYTQGFDGLVQSFPQDNSVAINGMVHEEYQSTTLGLKGIPSLAEELQIIRDLYLLAYTGGKLHIPTISTERSVQLIKEAKKKGLQVSCSVAIHNLILTDAVLENFNTHFKVLPPLRGENDRKALIKGLKDGVIDGVTSNHNPIDVEHKRVEFDFALFGSTGLESCFGALLEVLTLEETIKALTGLKSTFKIEHSTIEEGNKANLSLFNPDIKWILKQEMMISTSKNDAFLGRKFSGKAYGIIHNNKIIVNE